MVNVDFFARGECLMIIGIVNCNEFFSGCNAWVELFFSEMFLENKQSLSFTCFNARLSLMLHQRKKIFWVAPELFSMKKGRPGWYFRNTNLGFQLNKQSKLDPTQTTPLPSIRKKAVEGKIGGLEPAVVSPEAPKK